MLEIDRLSLNVRAAAAPDRAERLARRLRDAAVTGIERHRYTLGLAGAPAYVFVERLALQCSVSNEWDDDMIGGAVAKSLAAALERGLELPGTVAFHDRIEFLAAFYSALAEGRAWERWWFECFDGLKSLSASSALRTSVINEDAYGVAALARLTETALTQVLGLLTAADAKRMLAWFEQRRVAAETPLSSLWSASVSLPPAQQMDVRWIATLIAAERAAAGAAGAETLLVLHAMTALRAAAARGKIDIALFVHENPRASLRVWLSMLSLPLEWVDRLSESEVARIVQNLAARGDDLDPKQKKSETATGESNVPAVAERGFTRRGGAFVLLKALDWVGWPALWRGRLKCADADAVVRAFVLAVVARALNPEEATGTLRDSALRLAFDLDDPLTLLRTHRRDLRALLNAVEVGVGIGRLAQLLLDEFAQRIPGLAGASPDYLRRNALTLPATVERQEGECVVHLGRAPLDVLLVLSGAKRGRVALPGGASLRLLEDTAP